MKATKFKTHELDRCYAISPLTVGGERRILVAAEKVNKCLLFDTDGNLLETVWEAPGGTMSMVPVPGKDGEFLATHEFYSPNDSQRAHIVHVKKTAAGWEIRTVKDLPFCHRFSVITRGGVHYLIGCTIKNSHEYKEDWRDPGKIFAGELPADLENYGPERQIPMTVIREGLLKNHGYCTIHTPEGDYALIGAENGVFQAVPPAERGGEWTVEQLTTDPASDMALADFDGDGVEEMITISPFHGDQISVYKPENAVYQKVWDCPFKTEFAHSIWARNYAGQEAAIIGHRKGRRDLLAIRYEDGAYRTEVLDADVGSANIYPYDVEGEVRLVSTNREINEIAFYRIEV